VVILLMTIVGYSIVIINGYFISGYSISGYFRLL
jgi:hypothetical protein